MPSPWGSFGAFSYILIFFFCTGSATKIINVTCLWSCRQCAWIQIRHLKLSIQLISSLQPLQRAASSISGYHLRSADFIPEVPTVIYWDLSLYLLRWYKINTGSFSVAAEGKSHLCLHSTSPPLQPNSCVSWLWFPDQVEIDGQVTQHCPHVFKRYSNISAQVNEKP